MSELITTASDLWNEISKTAQFQHKEYDMNMLQEIRGKLGLPSNGSIPVLLKKRKVSCEELLNAVLSCMQPFGEMLNDLFIEQCDKVSKALDKLDSCDAKEDIAKSDVMKKSKRFLKECNDPDVSIFLASYNNLNVNFRLLFPPFSRYRCSV